MNRTGKILIFFVPGRFDEAIEINRDASESEPVLLIQGQGLLDKQRRNGCRTIRIKHGESFEQLMVRIFKIPLEDVRKHSIPRRVLETIEGAQSTPPHQTQATVTRGE